MESTLVIKVQYGDTLRRFNARVNGNENLDLDMLGLKAKIFSLFDFPTDTDVTLTYIDEDGDIVTLVDDDDLRDVMRQNLKFLKIIVTPNTERRGRSYARSSGCSTPRRSPSVQQPIPNIHAVVAEVMKTVPETLREAVSKLSVDLRSKSTSSSPTIVELVEQLVKKGVGHPFLNPVSQVGASASSTSPATAAEGTKEAGMPPDVLPKAASSTCSKKSPHGDSVAATPSVHPPVIADLHPIDLNVDPTVTLNPASDMKESQKVGGKPGGSSCSAGSAETTALPNRNFPQAMGFTGSSSLCPFRGLPLLNEGNMPSHGMCRSKRGCKPTDVGGVFHRGIRCDGCGVHPITGPRYKSLVKADYDLCSICFAEMGREGDYIRIDKPMSFRSMRGLKQVPQPWIPPTLPHVLRPAFKRGHPKLDSRFVSDVTIMDGTVMAPSTPFTKIWRMRNNGNFDWVSGTRLVWIGGDNFSEKDSVEIEVPPQGVHLDEELDIALDFVAPASPGRYISYWRMASPSGHKFGQRVWVLIQVDTPADDSADKTSGALNLNLPPETIGTILQEMNSQFAGGVDDFFGPSNSTTAGKPVQPFAEEQRGKEQEQNFPIDDALLVGNVASASAPPESSSTISYPIIDPSDVGEVAASVPAPATPAAPAPAPAPAPASAPASAPLFPAKEAVVPSGNAGAKGDVEQNLLKELAEMGFKQVDLNKEVLRMNSYDLEQSVDDLCGVSDWDPILEELQEMGFCDKEMNKRLLKKNDGSIRRVVMDLLTGEKA
ncbi:protein JOKA2 isoform X2 [Punica granatum]|uniref:Uncharacterized protein n=2 Tax=Punica granatum TaxID=22663 RepID=A0A2I0JS07_PUNGR|nr:protein JOKA2 isoform X2 [Punica granatum]PKI59089.1 hypothetical protein CRG98_020455 [Punica granatum]